MEFENYDDDLILNAEETEQSDSKIATMSSPKVCKLKSQVDLSNNRKSMKYNKNSARIKVNQVKRDDGLKN